ncbi:TIR domain-containing protein [Mycobacterium simiae]|uniref:TIR domain-containing protein n=1 Tax=Mycobacterium simiae TaxID=1784 RepID=A0A5B1BT52_MYCSI|nr:sensor domain-containing protein [Mycobacterium simiae]KAA1251857.1 TIR domain-containing protein [Mycobacterium simiae]
MAIFISYSSQDRSSLEALTTALRRAQQQVWFDQELGGGDTWWNKILEQIRASDVFIVALSNHWLLSKPSQAELRYAQALQRPILPVQVGPVDSVRVNPVSTLQIINYQNPTVDAGIQLVTAIHALREKAPPLPSPLPEEPPVPFGYLMRLGDALAEKELSPQQQLQMLVELRSGLDEDGDDPSARSDIAQLLRMLRMRHDVTYRTRTEIDNVLGEIGAVEAGAPGKPSTPTTPAQPSPAAASGPTPSAQPQPVSSPSRPSPSQGTAQSATDAQSNKRLIIIGGAALAVVVAIVLVVMFAMPSGNRKPAAKPGTSMSAAGPSAPTEPVLLGAAEIGSILGDQNMVSSAHGDQLRTSQGTLSDPQCIAAFEPLQESVYRPHDPTAVHSEVVHTSGDNPAHRVVEAAATFPSAEKARAFVQTSADKWGACAGKSITFTSSSTPTEWTFGDVTGAPPKIAQVRTAGGGSGRTCQHVMSAVSDVVIEVVACGTDVTDGASRIAEQIGVKAAK